MQIFNLSACCLFCALILASCDKGTSPTTNTQEESAAATPAQPTSQPSTATSIDISPQPAAWTPSDDPTVARFLNYVAPKSATWIEHPPSGMGRVANYTVPGRDGNEAAHIVIYYFGQGQGGTVEGNIARWQSQFQTDEDGQAPEPIVNRFEVNSYPVTTVDITGHWKEMGAVAFKMDQQFFAAIVELPEGNVFIRFVGNAKTVSANKDEFLEMIRGIKKSDSG